MGSIGVENFDINIISNAAMKRQLSDTANLPI